MSDIVSVERLIAAPPSKIFALIADPNRHQDIDGSGTVREARGNLEPLRLGAKFGMSMKHGIPYAMESTVIEYEQNRRLAWQTRGPGWLSGVVGGRIWRYELEPTDDGGTLVRETWDLSQESPLTKLSSRWIGRDTARTMASTLERIERLTT